LSSITATDFSDLQKPNKERTDAFSQTPVRFFVGCISFVPPIPSAAYAVMT
jgi:hypothetical protein